LRFFYADAGLLSNSGHYATYCREITSELRKRGITPIVLGYRKVDQRLREELGALPFFEKFTNWFSDGDPICGPLNAFHISAEAMQKDLTRLNDIGPNDIIYFSSVRPPQYYAIALWLRGIEAERMPRIVAEFANDPGLDRTADKRAFVIRDPRIDPTAMLLRFASCRTPSEWAGRLHLVTFETVMSQVYSLLLKCPVGVLPTSIRAMGPVRSRHQKRPVTVSTLGVQRANKGYHLMPEVIRGLLQSAVDVRILVHNSAPEQMAEQQSAIRALARQDSRITVDERVVGPKIWADLFEVSDLILCPYHPETFYASPSGIAWEAVANGIPFVGPADTALHRLMQEYNGCGVVFDKFEAASITQAVLTALSRFDDLANIAIESAKKFAVENGPARTVDKIIQYAHAS
jgi:hypothetical protein